MKMTGTIIRMTDKIARERLAKISEEDYRPYSKTLARLINEEWKRRHSDEKEESDGSN